MPQSLSRVIVHLTFSTYHRDPLLSEKIQPELFAYLAGILTNEGHQTIQVGGHIDHVHLLFGLSRTKTISQTVESVKTSSSKWIKTIDGGPKDFHWQHGYGIFSVSEGAVKPTVNYILNQDEHHRVVSYQDEVRRLYEESGIVFDERYAWE